MRVVYMHVHGGEVWSESERQDGHHGSRMGHIEVDHVCESVRQGGTAIGRHRP